MSLNIIDSSTYEKIKSLDQKATPKIIRNSKYKRKHHNEQPISLLDFAVKHRKKPIIVTRSILGQRRTFGTFKRKGKSRLQPKPHVTRLKRNIKNYRIWKKTRPTQSQDEEGLANEFQQLNLELVDSVKAPSTSANSASSAPRQLEPKAVHSRRFRSYCNNCTLPRLSTLVDQLIRDLNRFQKRAYSANPIKARAHQRFVIGFRQAQSYLLINKVKLLIIATDCEECPAEGGLDSVIAELKSGCELTNVPYCFPFDRRKLAYSLEKRAQISCVAILDFDGANATFKELLEVLTLARIEYNTKFINNR